jgi:two-component system NtrC family sensor kinase
LQKTSVNKKRVLWVDDEEALLSSVARLLRKEDYELVLVSDPQHALKLLKSESFSIVVSDQRMPSLTGIDLLAFAKEMQPLATRIMVTGFFDQELIADAVNNAAVYRFISKPWDEAELVHDLKLAAERNEILSNQQRIRKEISSHTQQLTVLTERLNEIVDERTRDSAKSEEDLEGREIRLSSLTLFMQRCSIVHNIEDTLEILRRELKPFHGWSTPYLAFSFDTSDDRLYYFNGKSFEFKKVKSTWPSAETVRHENERDQKFLADELGRPVGRILAFPFSKEIWHGSKPPILFIEKLGESKLNVLDLISERLQPLSIILNRIFLEKKMEFASRQWEMTFDSIPDPVAIIQNDYHVLRSNQAFAKNYSEKRVCYERIGNSSPCIGCPIGKSPSRDPQSFTIKAGHQKYEVSHYPINSDKNYFVHHYRDITGEQELYGQAIQNQKMAALGALAGNISHELNNPITGIQSLVQLLLTDERSPDSLKLELVEIEDAARRSHSIIRDFQEFTGGDESDLDVDISVDDVVKKTMPLLKTSLRNFETDLHFESENAKVRINPQMLQQVLFNLIINACQAMNDKGIVQIKTFARGNTTGFSVKDSGPGISDEILSRIFDPFFTTKPTGKGTGLGLSLCKKIVERSGGEIRVTTEKGKGSEFTISLPREK